MNRILPVLLLSVGISLHFMYCEWDFPADLCQVSQSQNTRTIFFRRATFHRRSPYKGNVFLLARESSNREEAQFHGVLLPALLIGGAAMLLRRPS